MPSLDSRDACLLCTGAALGAVWSYACSLRWRNTAATTPTPTTPAETSPEGAGAEAAGANPDNRLVAKKALWSSSHNAYISKVKAAHHADSQATRSIICGDAVEWMRGLSELPGSVLTGMPDIQEMLHLGDEGYSEWFIDAVALTLQRLPEGQIACFHQTDTRCNRFDTLSKVDLLFKGVRHSGVKATLLWHKVALAAPCGVVKIGRPSFTHMLCFIKGDAPQEAIKFMNFPDVVDRGQLTWARAMGVIAVMKSIEYMRWAVGDSLVVVDPFCGFGTVPAVANSLGLNSVGVDLSPNCCRKAERANTDALVYDRQTLLATVHADPEEET